MKLSSFLIAIFIVSISFKCRGQKQIFHPTDYYINKNRGLASIEIPQLQELIHILIAISPTGQADTNSGIINHAGEYYKEVIKNFNGYKDHKVVKTIDGLIKSNAAYYYFLKMDATGYSFNEENKIVKDVNYSQLSWNKKNVIDPLLADIEDFANKSGFFLFYKEHSEYYNGLIEEMKLQSPVEIQWEWLEAQFSERYDNYRITFSPLVGGSHSTQFFKAKNFKQVVMFVGGPIVAKKYNDKVTEGLVTRMIFTEIDHNYVNQVSHNYSKEIKKLFRDKNKWTDSGKGTDWYGSPEAVFNEYMTWAVFTLYAMRRFNQEDFNIINQKTEAQMVERRGFIKYKEFNEKLMELFKNKNEKETVTDLFPKIIEWCGKGI